MASGPQIWIRTRWDDARTMAQPGTTVGPPPQTEGGIVKVIRCECGYVARGDNDEQVLGQIESHLSSNHPSLLATVSRDDITSWIQAE
jgi:predicted small metal-binding protein